MWVRLLGTAAGGGFPQWNCNCCNCREVCSGTARVQPRTQTSVALSVDNRHWFLLNASPDVRMQLESFPPLLPSVDARRGSGIEAILLTSADLDHTPGLFFPSLTRRFT
jgi:pyrroloquinoline quinone biosynthesis protein B